MSDEGSGTQDEPPGGSPDNGAEAPSFGSRLRRAVVGAPRDFQDPRLHHRLALIPLLAWVGLGADGLSSSSYGPEEAFHALGARGYLALVLAAGTAFTVALISLAYARLIEDFPSGGGGYVVASKLLGHRAGVVSGSALLVDYMLTITVSVAAAGKAIFSFLPQEWQGFKGDDQKRWTTYTLGQEELQREINRQLDKSQTRIMELEDLTTEVKEMMVLIADENKKRYQTLIDMSNEWLESNERAFGRHK